MTDKAISPLRQRMIEDMTIRKFAPKTQHDYVQRVKNFAAFLGRSPDTASFEDVRRYQLHLATSGAGVPTLNQSVSTLRFFFKITLGRADIVNHTQFIHVPRKLPVILSPEEVARFLDAAPGLKYKAALSVAYGAGLRVSEVVALKVSDIDSKRMVIRIEQGIHDWNDERSSVILRNCRKALPEKGTLLLVERMMPEQPTESDADKAHAMSDLNMLRGPGGCERTEQQYCLLLEQSGFRQTSVRSAGRFSVIEARAC